MTNAFEETEAVKPTIVLVAGGFTDPVGWAALAAQLVDRGFGAAIVVNPLHGLEADTRAVLDVLKTVKGSIVLVGHSYGGMLISNAACASYNVEALVFVAALAPEKGETLDMLIGDYPDATPGEVTIEGAAGDPAWKILPSWFVYGDADECIPPQMHARFALRAGAVETVVAAGGVHDLAVSRPDEVIRTIEMAAEATADQVPNINPD